MYTPVSHRTAGREQPGTRTEQSGGPSETIFGSSFSFALWKGESFERTETDQSGGCQARGGAVTLEAVPAEG